MKTVEWLQWHDFSADPGGVLESEAHQRGSVGSLSVREGELEVEVGGAIERAKGRRDLALSLRSRSATFRKKGFGHIGLHSEGRGDGIARTPRKPARASQPAADLPA